MQVQNDAKPYDDINITPMLDLAYVLLVIFIIMTTATVQGQKVTRRSSTSLRFRTCSTIPGSKLPAETAMSDIVIVKLTLDDLRSVLQQVGYRVEAVTDPVANLPYLRSATGGLAFDIRPGNRLADADDSFVDVAFTAVLQVQGELPLDLVNRWNATRRFARLQLSQQFLVLSLDVSVAGGVMPDHLRAHVEIWDRLVQELIAYLREELRDLSAKSGATPPVAPQAPERESEAKASATTTIQ